MEGNNLIKKGLAVVVIVLFIGLACAPSINANISKGSNESELIEITTEICGLNGGKHMVHLTKEDALEVENLIDDIKRRLDEVETREETIEIFNRAVVELDKYGLLGDMGVEQAQKLTTGGYQNSRSMKLLEKLFDTNQATDTNNYLCLITGETTETRLVGLVEIGCSALLYTLFVIYFISELAFGLFVPILLEIRSSIVALNNFYQNMTFPIIGGTGIIAFGGKRPSSSPGPPLENYHAEGWVWTQGLNGNKSWNGTFYGIIRSLKSPIYAYQTYYIGAIGFLGIKLTKDDGKQFFLGSTLRVGIDNDL
jgi:hypothetical protein